MKTKIIRTSTVAMSLNLLLKGQLSFLSKHYDVIAVSGFDNDLEVVKNREKVAIQDIKMERKIAPIKDIVSLYKLYCFFKKEKPTIVHSITPKAGLLSMVAAKYANVPIRIHTFTGLVFPAKKGLFQKLLIFMDKVLCHHATHIIPEGEGVKKDLIEYHITSKTLQVLANGNINGIDTTFFDPNLITLDQKLNLRKKLHIQNDDFVFIFVGRLVADKGINELISAFVKFSDENKKCKLLLVGQLETDLDPLKRETLNAINNNQNIISVGFQSEVRHYYAISNALVFPSYREGFPNVVMQAGAMGLPSIVSDINGCNEIIKENFKGIIIPKKNTSAIFDAMKILVLNHVLYNQLKSNSRKNIVQKYEQQLVWQAILCEYQKLEKVV